MRVAGAGLWQRSTTQRHGCVGLGEINMRICIIMCTYNNSADTNDSHSGLFKQTN